MFNQIIDSHIHLDLYSDKQRQKLLKSLDHTISGLITVSFHLESSKQNLELSREFDFIHPAFGFHPEQEILSDQELEKLFSFIIEHHNEMIAIGEVGLPYYKKQEDHTLPYEAYIEVLEQFIKLAKKLDKPIILHSIYEDAALVCNILEEYNMKNAHFHWFKGDPFTLERMMRNGYYISITPDVLYEREIIQIVRNYPLEQLMVETDGPWGFEGPFSQKMTHPSMIHTSIRAIADIKKISIEQCYQQLFNNTKYFYF